MLGDTWTISPNLINVFTYGEAREFTGQPVLFNPGGSLYELTFDSGSVSNPFIRQTSFVTVAPEPTFRDDMTWVHGNHTFTFGGEINPVLFKDGITNDFTFIQQGLGGNISSLSGSANLLPADILNSDVSNWSSAFVGSLGTIFNLQAAINFDGQGNALPQGSPVAHYYRVNNFAGYFSDSWRVRHSLTVTLGMRYQIQTVPYEIHGVQASFQNTNFNSIIQARLANGLAGIATPTSTPLLTYSLSGKANHAPGLYSPDYHDFSPRLGIAWNPSYTDGFLGKILGDHKTVVRLGASIIFDDTAVNNIIALQNQGDYTFGGSFAENFGDSSLTATPTENLGLMPRFNSISSAPTPVIDPPFQTPITPFAIFNYDVDNQFRTPYSIVTSFGIQRELPFGLQFEADYYGRFGRRLFVLADAAQTMDFTSDGQKLSQAFTILEKDAQQNVVPTAVAAQPFFESLFGPGSTQAIYASFSGQATTVGNAAGSSMAEGNTGLMVLELGLQPTNIGLTPQFFVNALATNLGSSSYNSLFTTLRKQSFEQPPVRFRLHVFSLDGQRINGASRKRKLRAWCYHHLVRCNQRTCLPWQLRVRRNKPGHRIFHLQPSLWQRPAFRWRRRQALERGHWRLANIGNSNMAHGFGSDCGLGDFEHHEPCGRCGRGFHRTEVRAQVQRSLRPDGPGGSVL